MIDSCEVSGLVYRPDGVLARHHSVRFVRAEKAVSVQGDATIVPTVVFARTDGLGSLIWDNDEGETLYYVPLVLGAYDMQVADVEGAPFPKIRTGVPDAETAILAQIINAPPPPSLNAAELAVAAAERARDEAREYARQASEGGGGAGDTGPRGLSAYDVAVEAGFAGSEADWLASLVGPAGRDGHDGIDGAPGRDGADGVPGHDGSDGRHGDPGLSAYEVALDAGFEGTEADWLVSLIGADGRDGANGADGQPGRDGRDGEDGAHGRDGANGIDGADGADGQSAQIIGFDASDEAGFNAAVAAHAGDPLILVVRYADP